MIRALLILLPFTAFGQCECIGEGYEIVVFPHGAYVPDTWIDETVDSTASRMNAVETGRRAALYIASKEREHAAERQQHAAEVSALETANAANVQEAQEQTDRAAFAEEKSRKKGKTATIAIAVAVAEGAWIVGTNLKRP